MSSIPAIPVISPRVTTVVSSGMSGMPHMYHLFVHNSQYNCTGKHSKSPEKLTLQ